MKTFFVTGFYYRIIKAESPVEALAIYLTEDMSNNAIWSREDARQLLLKNNYSTLSTTQIKDVFEITKGGDDNARI